MTGLDPADRRTVLKTVTAAAIGGGLATGTTTVAEDNRANGGQNTSHVVEIVAEHGHEEGTHEFTLSADEIPAGWTTFEFTNTTRHAHFAYLSKVPQAAIDAATEQNEDLLDFYIEHVTRPFQWLMDTLVDGKDPDPDDRFSEEMLFPTWFADVRPSGGPGLTSGNRTSTTTLTLDPGEYIVECYVKNAANEFHSSLGMIESLTVTETQSGTEPEATLDLSVSTDGIDAADTVAPGQHTVAVQFEDQQLYEHDLGHDVHLIRFDEDTTVTDLNTWLNWKDPAQLVSDGTEPGTFVGGADTILTPGLLDGSATETAYVHLDLVPGEYAWVSEVPDPSGKGLLQEFTVPFGAEGGSE